MPRAPSQGSWNQPWSEVTSSELSAALDKLGTLRTLADGELLCQRGDPGKDLYGVKSGCIRVGATAPDGHEGILGLYGPGTWFGEVSFFDERPRAASTYAVGTTQVRVVPAARLRAILDANPVWYRDFARVLCGKLRLALTHVESTFLPLPVRVAARLLDLARAYGESTADGTLIALKLPQEELGRMLGLTRQSVNKELRGFEARGWLRIRRGAITVLDAQALHALVREGGGADLLHA